MSFIRNYLVYATANEAPEMFHVWGAYVCLAAVTSRRVWFPSDDGFLYTHLYVLYVGKAGNGKGEAMRKAKWVLSRLGDVPLSGNVETPEGFIRYICGNPNGKPPVPSAVRKILANGPMGIVTEYTPMTIFATEFINYIAPNPEGWINVLNDIWDAEPNYHYRTKGQGEDVIPGPSISLLGALTTDVAADLQKQRIIGTGLGRRTIFQYGERQWDNPCPRRIITPERELARDTCIEQLRRIRKLTGLMYNSPEPQGEYVSTDEWWDQWYCENLRQTPKQPLNIQSWYASKPDIVIKLAMLTALSEESLCIYIRHYAVALDWLARLEEDLPRIFGGVGRNELAAVAQRIGDYIKSLRIPEPLHHLRAQFFNDCKPPTDFEVCVQYLLDTEQVDRAEIKVGQSFQTCLASPEVISRYRENQSSVALGGATLSEVNPNLTYAAGPSPELSGPLAVPDQEGQVSVGFADETVTFVPSSPDQLREVEKYLASSSFREYSQPNPPDVGL